MPAFICLFEMEPSRSNTTVKANCLQDTIVPKIARPQHHLCHHEGVKHISALNSVFVSQLDTGAQFASGAWDFRINPAIFFVSEWP